MTTTTAPKRAPRRLSAAAAEKAETPLLGFIRGLGELKTKQEFAEACGTTLPYLYQLCAKEEPNPTLKLAMALVEQSAVFGKNHRLRPLTFDDLLVGASPQ